MFLIQDQMIAVISIHALREEGDARATIAAPEASRFLSTPSARRATYLYCIVGADCAISIHALREEGDRCWWWTAHHTGDFYPRPPRGGRLAAVNAYQRGGIFLSTPSARRATTTTQRGAPTADISIHALREEGDYRAKERQKILRISIHALREEGDAKFCPAQP